MPKKATAVRSRAQRNKPKAQKSFELVRPESALLETEESTTASTNTATATAAQPEPKISAKVATLPKSKTSANTTATTVTAQPEPKAQESQITPPSGSASARLAARRQTTLRMQQRAATTLITSEHFAYVRQDLIRIAVFAVLMVSAIIMLYWTFGRS
jgi:hypothetical protein